MDIELICFKKLIANSEFLNSLYHRGRDVEDIPNFQLFDDDYKLALKILYTQRYPCRIAAYVLALDPFVVYLVRLALDSDRKTITRQLLDNC